MEVEGGDKAGAAGVQEATLHAKQAVGAARDKVKQNLEELKDIQAQLQSAREDKQAGRDVNVPALERRISDIQLSMTASVEEAGREVSQATDLARAQYQGKAGSAQEQGAYIRRDTSAKGALASSDADTFAGHSSAPHLASTGEQGPSHQDVMSSVDEATSEAIDATHENQALLEKEKAAAKE